MIGSLVFVWAIVAVLAYFVFQREGTTGLKAGADSAVTMAKGLLIRMPLALLTASFLIHIIPVDPMSNLIGPASGLRGIILSSVAGGLLPGGPMTSFPIAIVFLESGAGIPQMVALIAGWSVFALHRILAYEAPIMGLRFIALRVGSSILLPVIAGLIAQLIVSAIGAA
ncbi:hypothetical protein [Pseudooceanicola sp. MF1-13]|uniref:hypothetical protein n=1 Tax=Pseudooceanicola sp. MF1-13 TaxID=3379095 RepID=UPI0038926234